MSRTDMLGANKTFNVHVQHFLKKRVQVPTIDHFIKYTIFYMLHILWTIDIMWTPGENIIQVL